MQRLPLVEARRRIRLNRHTRREAEGSLRQRLADGRREFETVTAEAHRDEHTFAARHCADDRVPVGRDVVGACPPGGVLRVREGGHAARHQPLNARHVIQIHVVRQRVGVFDGIAVIARADQHHAAGLGPEVNLVRRRQVFDRRPVDFIRLIDLERDDLVAADFVGELDADHRAEIVRPRPGGHDDDRCLDVARRRLHRFRCAVHLDPDDGRIGVDCHAEVFRAVDVQRRREVRIAVTGARVVADDFHAVETEQGMNLARFGGSQSRRVDPVLVLRPEHGLHRLAVRFRAEDDVAGIVPACIAAHDFGEVLEDFQALDCVNQIGANRVVSPADGARLGRAAGANRFAFEQDDVLHAVLGEVVRRTATHDAAADDDDVGCLDLVQGQTFSYGRFAVSVPS